MWYMYMASFHSSACTPPSPLVILTSSIPLPPCSRPPRLDLATLPLPSCISEIDLPL
ncbi:hypothetical protein C8R44DRAFT_787608 [Mycena epipterygia]|nr:hypothetical protein C8R44DRAFT_787608 [Mycena epipterygia]